MIWQNLKVKKKNFSFSLDKVPLQTEYRHYESGSGERRSKNMRRINNMRRFNGGRRSNNMRRSNSKKRCSKKRNKSNRNQSRNMNVNSQQMIFFNKLKLSPEQIKELKEKITKIQQKRRRRNRVMKKYPKL